MRNAIIALFAIVTVAACETTGSLAGPPDTEAEAAETAAIIAVLEAQDAAWNRGDIDGFMEGYWQSPDLRFASGGTVIRGFEPTRQRYHATYGTPDAMGRLETTDYEVDILSPDAAIAYGHWQLMRAEDAPSGLYTLIMRKIDGEWRIVSDTTTSAD